MDERIIRSKLEILRAASEADERPVTGWEMRTAVCFGRLAYRDESAWVPATLPCRARAGRTLFLRARAEAPRDWPAEDTYFAFRHTDLEGLLSVDGKPYAGIDAQHCRTPAPGTGAHDLLLEFFAVPEFFHRPQSRDREGVLEDVRVLRVNREIEAAYYDIRFAWEGSQAASDERRRLLLQDAVEAALLAIDSALTGPSVEQEAAAARRLLRDRLARIAPDPEAGTLVLAGHTHIDTAWLWPIGETVRKCARTFSTACRLMDRYPEFRFACSQAQLFAFTKKHYPELFADIKKHVAEGRWETTGAMWVEADCNATSGESLIRQILHGLRFFRDEFNTRPTVCWLPDVFGYPASLPEILSGCGVTSFWTFKLFWQARNEFPLRLFRWRGLDGSEVIAHVANHVGAYNGDPNPFQLAEAWRRHRQKADCPEVLFPYGWGDGGGGVTEEMQEMARRAARFPGLPATRVATPESFFAGVRASAPNLPVWDGELYLETHRGTYTTIGRIKRDNRRGELALREAELWAGLAMAEGRPVDAAPLADAWEALLLHQFHDILPGSSVIEVYREAADAHAGIRAAAESVAAKAVAALGAARSAEPAAPGCLTVFNALSWERHDPVEAEIDDPGGDLSVTDADGRPQPTQVLRRADGKAVVQFAPVSGVPSIGFRAFRVAPRAAPAGPPPVRATARRIETPFYEIDLNETGGLVRLYDKRHGREAIPAGEVANDLQLLQDGPEPEAAWNIHETMDKRRYAFEGPASVEVAGTGPVSAIVRVTRRHRASSLVQDIVAYAADPRIDFRTRVDWNERDVLLKAAFPLAVRATRAAYEIQFGALERPTTRNTSWEQAKFEVPAQRWADLSESGYGVSLLNDCKYGHDARDHVLRITLLRATSYPAIDGDRGRHEFTYSLLPHAGDWQAAQTVRRAWELNVPARARPGLAARAPAYSYLSVTGHDAVIEAMKPAEDGRGLILRVYEPHGGRGEAEAAASFPVREVVSCNLVEEDQAALPVAGRSFRFALRPFEIRTFRLLTG